MFAEYARFFCPNTRDSYRLRGRSGYASKLFQGLAQTATMDFPILYPKHGSKTCETGTIHRSQKPSCSRVGINCRSSNRFAVDAISPSESRYLSRIRFKHEGETCRKVERLYRRKCPIAAS